MHKHGDMVVRPLVCIHRRVDDTVNIALEGLVVLALEAVLVLVVARVLVVALVLVAVRVLVAVHLMLIDYRLLVPSVSPYLFCQK